MDEGTGDTVGERREKQGEAKDGKQHQSGDAAELIRSYRPAATHGGETGYQGKGDRHSREQGQAALAKGLVGAGKNERQHGQDARAQNREDATEIRQEQQEHLLTMFFPATNEITECPKKLRPGGNFGFCVLSIPVKGYAAGL